MLQLFVTDVDICRISKDLARKRLRASITNSTIIIDADEIPEDVVDIIFSNATIIGAQNYQLENSGTKDCAATEFETESESEPETESEFETESKFETESETESETDDEASMISIVEEYEPVDTRQSNDEGNSIEEILPSEYAMEIIERTTESSKSEACDVKEEMPIEMSTYVEESNEETIDSEYSEEETSDMFWNFGIESDNADEPSNGKIPKSEMVHRGEVYRWGQIRDDEDREGKIKECVIIIQNDYQNSASEDTIALFCTTHYEERAPIRSSFRLSKGTMIDHSASRLGLFNNCAFFVGRIKGVNRNQLGEYLGTMNNVFMNTLQPAIDFCLGLKRSRTVNWAQIRILSTVNMEDLFIISEANVTDEVKVEEFLELFGFNMSWNGMEYVKEAILIARDLSDYRLELLAEIIAEKKAIDASKVLRVIVARIKENFHFKKSPASSFIRLIERLLKKG